MAMIISVLDTGRIVHKEQDNIFQAEIKKESEMNTIEIYYDDLSKEKQKEVLEAAGVNSPEDMNWDTFPFTCVDLENVQ